MIEALILEARLSCALLLIELVVCVLPPGHPALLQLCVVARSLAR